MQNPSISKTRERARPVCTYSTGGMEGKGKRRGGLKSYKSCRGCCTVIRAEPARRELVVEDVEHPVVDLNGVMECDGVMEGWSVME